MGDTSTVPVAEVKKPWLSKTLWMNVIIAVTTIAWPRAQWFIIDNVPLVTAGWAVVNMVLRYVSKDTLQITD